MALQGDLRSFALPDVLRLLAGTAKSGRLAVAAPMAAGEVWMRDGGVAGGLMTSAPHATSASDVIFEMLRLPEGSFTFDEDEDMTEGADGDVCSVDDALTEAEALVAQWADVETVVPSMDAWITFAPELDADEVTITAASWRALATIGNGGTVADLADALEMTDLATSREVKALVESGLATVRLDHVAHEAAFDPASMPVQEPEPFDPEALHREIYDDLEVLRADERPVIMESSDDALLPEPLPGEGVSYAADTIDGGTVDGRFDAVDHEAPDAHIETAAQADDEGDDDGELATVHDMPMAVESADADQDEADEIADEPMAEDEDDAYFGDVPRHDFHGKSRGITSLEQELAEGDPDYVAPVVDENDDAPYEDSSEDDRGSLLRFLSTVQP